MAANNGHRRQADRRHQTRQKLLDAAFILFGQRGIETVSLDEIAVQAGVSKGAVFYHFESRGALIEAVVEQITRDDPSLSATVSEMVSDPKARLLASYWVTHQSEPQQLQLVS